MPAVQLRVDLRPPVWHVSVRVTRFDQRPWLVAGKKIHQSTIELSFAPARLAMPPVFTRPGGIELEPWTNEMVGRVDRSLSWTRPIALKVSKRTLVAV